MNAVRHAVGLPNIGDYGDPRLLVELGTLAERAGWDGFFLWDHIAYRKHGWPVADPQVVVAALAAVTSRIRLGVPMVALARRRPQKVARELASLDNLTGGRLVFGGGIGSQPVEEFEAFGEPAGARERAERLDEALEIVTGLCSGEEFSFSGDHFEVAPTAFLPRPVQEPRIPVWIAGRWPARRPFARAARWDGVFPTHAEIGHAEMMTPAQLKEIVDFTIARREEPSRPFDVVMEGQTDGSDPVADGRLVSTYADVGLTWWVEKLGWFRGPVEGVRRRIEAGPPPSARSGSGPASPP